VGGVDPLFVELQAAVAGRYSLERELGRGGMGIVYLARDVSLDRPIAIKLLPPELAERPSLRQRFLREARLAARLSHPNIVPIHAVEEKGRLVWFVMAFVPGQSLGECLRQRGALPPAEVARILRDVAYALAYAHGQGVVHRDVKPDNILLEAGGRRALIADFGIAAPLAEDAEGGVVGTVAYLSPEQAHGERVDPRSDLYGLGVAGYFALSARLPYPAASLATLVERQLAGPPPMLATVAPHAPRALCRAIDRCLAPLPAARFQTADELAGALEQLGGGSTDLPAPLRVWLASAERPRSALLLITAVWGLPLLIWMFFALATGAPGMGMAMLLSLALALFPWLLYGTSRLLQTRRLLKAGYRYADIQQALALHAERRHEELTFEYGAHTSPGGRIVAALQRIALGVGLCSIPLALLVGPTTLGPVAFTALATAGGLHVLRRWIPGGRAAPRDGWVDFSLKIWKSRAGPWLARIAGWRLGRTSFPEQVLHRPTEVALGEAADALFRALPEVHRRTLKSLPEEIRQLANQAQAMRRKIAELDDLIATAAPTTLFGEGRPHSDDGGAAELTEARGLWAERLRETVTLLESLRLGLLRLHAGSAVPETLTADLEAARELQQRLHHLVSAEAEANQLLHPPPRHT
jgi:serine/threonine-protein kinase